MSWDDLLSYLYTFSSLHTFHEKYPGDKDVPSGDIAKRFWKQLQEHAAERDGSRLNEVDVEWPMALLLARRA